MKTSIFMMGLKILFCRAEISYHEFRDFSTQSDPVMKGEGLMQGVETPSWPIALESGVYGK